MMTTRRRIKSEQERFGGYGIQPSNTVVTDEQDTQTVSDNRFSFEMRRDEPSYTPPTRMRSERISYADTTNSYPDTSMYVPTEQYSQTYTRDNITTPYTDTYTRDNVTVQPQTQQPPVIEYSTRQDYTGNVGMMRTPVIVPVGIKSRKKREKEDIMPSIKTQAYGMSQIKENDAQDEYLIPRKRAKISGKMKAALVAYFVGVVIMAVMVIATGLAINNINAKASALETEIEAKNVRLMEQSSEIARLTDHDRIVGAAMNSGMEKIDSRVEVEIIPETEPMTYEGRTNWFDKFCDFLSKIVGG